MMYKLRLNAHKGRWEHKKVAEYMAHVREEVTELDHAIGEGNMIEVVLEAADVANMAMIVSSMAIEGRE
jgi:NTP pyrophosphatase (non-canonical NTP hydrolase)